MDQNTQQALKSDRMLAICAMALCIFMVCFVRTAEASEVSPLNPAEYMIYQYPGVSLLIRIDTLGVEFESRVYGPDRALIKASHVPSRRIGPVYQLIDAVGAARQLMIEVTPAHPSERERIVLELVQLPQDSRTSALQAEAFRLMSRAAESTSASDSSTWAMKTYTFDRAAGAFEQLGWEELRLWNEYFVAHLVYYQMNDRLSGIELARQVQASARKAGVEVIEMVALQLEGAALLANSDGSQAELSAQDFSEVHRVFRLASELAENLGFQSEQALALFSDGTAWEREENYTRALEQYRLALGVAIEAGDTELANRIRNDAAFAYETQGSIAGAIEMLDQIGDQLSEKEAARELAQSLYEKGRILNRHYRYREATDSLSEALALTESADSEDLAAQTGFTLGSAYYQMGLMNKAVGTLRESMARVPASGHEKELEGALGMLAAIHRSQRDVDAMKSARKEQEAFVVSDRQRAKHLFESALDLIAISGPDFAAASSMLRKSRELSLSSGSPLLAHRALLTLCSEKTRNAAAGKDCTPGNIRQSFDFLVSSGSPRIELEARVAWSNLHRREGRLDLAVSTLSEVIAKIRHFRLVLPGVLGAWYWENRDQIFNQFMTMVLRQALPGSSAAGDGGQALIALERMRTIVSADSSGNSAAWRIGSTEHAEQIRSLLAARESDLNEKTELQEAAAINDTLYKSRENFRDSNPDLEFGDLKRLLSDLPVEATLLTYYFSTNEVYAIVADGKGARVFRLSRPAEIQSGLNELRNSLRNPATIDNSRLASLGKLMLGPFVHSLTELIYLMPSGPVSGVPFDLFRLDERYLAEQYRVLMLMSLSALADPESQVRTRNLDLIFLAGNPDVKREVFNYDQEMSAEIRAVTDIFVGPALHIVQGAALRRDEFQDERFEKADVVHLAIPGLVSLEYPMQSKLMLSGTLDQPGTEFLTPRDFQNRHFNASLAVLSSMRVHGSGASSFNGYLGFVSDLLQSGADSVVASLWLLEDSDLAGFMDAFYRNLADEPNVSKALLKTRRQLIFNPETQNVSVWGGFQLYID